MLVSTYVRVINTHTTIHIHLHVYVWQVIKRLFTFLPFARIVMKNVSWKFIFTCDRPTIHFRLMWFCTKYKITLINQNSFITNNDVAVCTLYIVHDWHGRGLLKILKIMRCKLNGKVSSISSEYWMVLSNELYFSSIDRRRYDHRLVQK